jgi:hypothetical protein
MDTVKIIQMIETTLSRKGNGIENDPIRVITQYWDMAGNLLFEIDPFLGTITGYGILNE